MVKLLFRAVVQPAAGYKGNAVVNTKISLSPVAGGAVGAVIRLFVKSLFVQSAHFSQPVIEANKSSRPGKKREVRTTPRFTRRMRTGDRDRLDEEG